jgi:hypothetical protein
VKKYYKAQILDICVFRASDANYQYAVIYRNLITQNCGASFHKTLENAVSQSKVTAKRTFLEVLDVRKVYEITKDEYEKRGQQDEYEKRRQRERSQARR